MKFSIITPTYKRATSLLRAIESVKQQTYTDWEMIIVNDSPDDTAYADFPTSINDSRIKYSANDKNRGVNFTRNHALDKISSDSEWIIFLDDDDYFAPDALKTFCGLIQEHKDNNWLITNRTYKNGEPITKIPINDTNYSYAIDYLILKRCKGDVTHCIKTTELQNIRFPKNIKQGEEWFLFYQLGLKNKMFYHSHDSTITDGYDNESGLNFRKRTMAERLASLSTLFYDGIKLNLIYQPTFILYLCIRFFRTLFLSNKI